VYAAPSSFAPPASSFQPLTSAARSVYAARISFTMRAGAVRFCRLLGRELPRRGQQSRQDFGKTVIFTFLARCDPEG
jgi:hypothetical protein